MDDTTVDGIWYKGIKSNMKKLITNRKIEGGESLDESATDIFLEHVRLMVRALARADHAEASARAFAIITIWRAAGRASEPAHLSFNGLRWNALFQTATIESPQSKPSKLKYVVFCAGGFPAYLSSGGGGGGGRLRGGAGGCGRGRQSHAPRVCQSHPTRSPLVYRCIPSISSPLSLCPLHPLPIPPHL